MSGMFASPPDDDRAASRNSALWGLAALGIIAVLVVVVLIVTSGGGGGGHNAGQRGTLPVAPPTVPVHTITPTPTPLRPRATPSTSAPTAPTSSAPTSPVPTSTANPCPSAKPCAVQGDAGQLIAALNRFRVKHGQRAVPGTVSPKAQQCALAEGDGSSCEPSWSWEPVPTQDGPRVIRLIAGRGDDWLLDPAMKSFSVGWAYAPGAHQYECAVLKVS